MHKVFGLYAFLENRQANVKINLVVEATSEFKSSLPKDSSNRMQMAKNNSEQEMIFYKQQLKEIEDDEESENMLKTKSRKIKNIT